MCSQLTGKASVTRSNVAMLQPCEGKDSATLGTHSLEFLHFGKMSIFIYYDIKTLKLDRKLTQCIFLSPTSGFQAITVDRRDTYYLYVPWALNM